MSYYIGSFNLRDFNFSNQSTDNSGEKLKRNFEKIAQIIVKEKFDVVALQEINAELPLKHLTEIINRTSSFCKYDFRFGAEMPTCNKDPERYGFIWNTKRLRLIKPRRGKNPGYYENAGVLGLIRPPYYARFTNRGMLGGSNMELRLINTHIRADAREGFKEFNILVKQALPGICDHQEITEDGEILQPYTFLLGDYNLELNKSERAIYKIETITATKYTGKGREFKTVQEKPTSLRMPEEQSCIEECYANNYDHFTYESDLDQKLVLTPQRIEALSKYYAELSEAADKLEAYRTEVSDHVPIGLHIDLK